jgi:hypothetical protein
MRADSITRRSRIDIKIYFDPSCMSEAARARAQIQHASHEGQTFAFTWHGGTALARERAAHCIARRRFRLSAFPLSLSSPHCT